MLMTVQRKIRKGAMGMTAAAFVLILARGTADAMTGTALGMAGGFISLLLLSGMIEHLAAPARGQGMFFVSAVGKALICGGMALLFCLSGVPPLVFVCGFTAAQVVALLGVLRSMKEVPVD